MKQNLIITVIVGCLLLCACVNKASVGVIGGADGPTNVYVSSKNNEIVKKPIRMIKVDGKLYYDSGRVSEIVGRCGNLDGNLTRVGEEYEIPQNDNECNFDGADGYQNVTDITKEIYIDGEWIVFRLFDDADLDMSQYQYCYYLKGRMANDEKDGEIVVLSEDINIDYATVMKQLFSSQYNPNDAKYKTTFREYNNSDKWGLSLTASNITNRGLTIKCEQFGGAITGELQTGEWFSLDINDGGEWKPVETNPLIDYEWNSIAYSIKKNDITELTVDWSWLYGELKPGYYRISKEITDFRAAGDYDKEIYQIDFTVED